MAKKIGRNGGLYIIMYKLIGQMDKGGHYDMQMKGWALCGNIKVDAKVGIMMCKLKGQIDKGGHYDVEKKGWMEKRAI